MLAMADRLGWIAAGLLAGVAIAAPVLAAGLQERAAGGWLQLDQEQASARRQAGPLTPRESLQLDAREQQERLRLRETLQTQEWEHNQARRTERRAEGSGVAEPGSRSRPRGIEMRQERELEALRLRRQIDRRIQGTPPGRPGLR
jgi:hypothetical protein